MGSGWLLFGLSPGHGVGASQGIIPALTENTGRTQGVSTSHTSSKYPPGLSVGALSITAQLLLPASTHFTNQKPEAP